MAGYFNHYMGSAMQLLDEYNGNEPFASFAKAYFKRHKKFGSRDRKIIADLCYGYLRLGRSASKYTPEEQIIIGFYLTHQTDNGFLGQVFPAFKNSVHESLQYKTAIISERYPEFNLEKVFPYHMQLSSRLNRSDFALSHLQKPCYFIKIRPGKHQKVFHLLKSHEIQHQIIEKDVIGFEQNIDLSELLSIDEDVVVQDISSQHTLDVLDGYDIKGVDVWDACAGGGGKTILSADKYHFASHYVSDLRPNVLEECIQRMKRASIPLADSFCVDLSHPLAVQAVKSHLPGLGVELIIADVPCSGSGTWGRSPEWLRMFDVDQIKHYHDLQISIVENLLPFLKKGGYLLYITCSVFEEENERVITTLKQKHTVKVLHQTYKIGYPLKGDQLFTALITL